VARHTLTLRAVPDALAALTLGLGCLAAVVWSSASWSTYHRFIEASIGGSSVTVIIANGLLTVLFLAIGIELSIEIHSGALRNLRHSMAPLAGAFGGMAFTALLSAFGGLALSSTALMRGWGVPMATDVALVIGMVALAGPSVPREVRTFLLTLAIADDVGSLVVLGATGSLHANVAYLVISFLLAVLAWLLRCQRVAYPLLLLVPLWLCLARAGTEPALAGVVIGVCIQSSDATARFEQLVNWSSTVVVLPLFTLSACGLNWTALRWTTPVATTTVAMVVIRLVGKSLGIVTLTMFAKHLGAPLSVSLTKSRLFGVGLLCAMGFTVPLLFARVVFGPNAAQLPPLTIALLVATVLGGAGGLVILRRSPHTPPNAPGEGVA